MNSIDRIAMKGGHKVLTGTSATTDYHFEGFIPQENTTFTSLKMGDDDVTPTGVTYYAGIFYGAPNKVGPGYYTQVQLASGSIVLALTTDSPTKY